MDLYRRYFRTYKIPFLAGALCVTLEAFCDLLNPTLMALVINTGIERQSIPAVLQWGSLMLLVTALGAIFAVARNILASNVSQRMGADLRHDLFAKIVRFSEGSVDRIESGSLITRLTNDTSQIVQFVNGIMRIFLKAPITCLGSIILATLLNPRLSLILYGVVAVVSLLIVLSMKLSYPRFARLQKTVDRMNAVVQEYLLGIRLVKAFGTFDQEAERFAGSNGALMRRSVASQMVITLIAPLLSLTVGLGTVLIIWAGGLLYPMGRANVGDITAFTIYMTQILSSLLIITNVFNTFVRTKASTERLTEVFESPEDFCGTASQADGTPGKKPLFGLSGDIEFENVTFAYPGGSGVPVLRDLSFSVRHGDSLAIIGPTGSGKTTLLWLLLRFYDTDSGRILLDGCDIRDLDVNAVRANIAVAPQNPALFAGSAAENLRWGRRDATEDELQAAAARARADFLFQRTGSEAKGLDGRLESGGVNLSGGQKQRLSIARGLLRDAPVLILDDATSALDAITEAQVRRELLADKGKRTILFITQRIATAMAADRILVLEDGVSAGFGSHRELLEQCGVYSDIYRSQVENAPACGPGCKTGCKGCAS